jgi:alpha-beta hydrolase superfamily lysophospholipase
MHDPERGADPLRSIRASDGVVLRFQRWPSRRPQTLASVVFLHGIASHGGWFGETAADLSERGIAVYAPDRRGSGRSGGPRGHLDRYERALDDVDEVMHRAASDHPGVPVYLAASSWAAKLAIVYVTQPRRHPTGLMLLGPGLFPTVDLPLAGRLAVVGGHAVVPTAHLEIPLTPEHYTTNPHYLDVIKKDRFRLLSVTLRFYWETARLDRRRSKASAAIALPLLVLQGESDRMMDVPRTLAWVGGLPTDDATYVSYPGAGHTLDFEPDRSAYLDDMLGWMSARGMRA